MNRTNQRTRLATLDSHSFSPFNGHTSVGHYTTARHAPSPRLKGEDLARAQHNRLQNLGGGGGGVGVMSNGPIINSYGDFVIKTFWHLAISLV